TERHTLGPRPFTFDANGVMHVTVGAPSNACQEKSRPPGVQGMDPCPQLEWHGGIWQFSADEANQQFKKDGKRYATGIRNAVAIYSDAAASHLYAVQHGRDHLTGLLSDYNAAETSTEQPAQE